ncbi:MAG: Ig-like domain-containing protein [Tannerella sp.]|jgi:uncharacterized protein (DUF2141 family)|nr:Ig-like domain-containing protein [Tannerella sp.]
MIIKKYKIALFLAVTLIASVFSCANIGNPNGGPYDETPPKFISSKPAHNQLNFKGKEIEVVFDEFVTIDNPSENVIVTPPQKQIPIIQGLGKKIRVQLKDTLPENTTCTIDFTSSIADNNAKNVLENFSFAFSTGNIIDTLTVSGRLLDAENLEPLQKMIVGIHKDLSDTAFTKTPLLRVSKTDERGRFVVHNISPGEYNVFALEDKNRNYAYDKNGDEGLAFLDSTVHPYSLREMVPDTIWKDTITVDTVKMVEKTIFYPKDLILWCFKDSISPRQRLLKPDRPQEFIMKLKFNAPMDTFPVPQPINFEPVDSVWYLPQKAEDAETFAINYWILDSTVYKTDTLLIGISYWKNNDSIPDLLELKTDTITLANKAAPKKKPQKPKQPPKVKPNKDGVTDSIGNKEEKTPAVLLQISISPGGSLNPEDIITIKFNEPVLDIKKDYFKLELARDTLWDEAEFEFVEDSTVAMTYYMKRTFKYEERYRLFIDSASLCSVYGHCNDKASVNLTVKSEKDYGHLIVNIEGLPESMPAIMELLNTSGTPVRKAVVKDGVATFMNMAPEKYFGRIILDENGNGKWDGGNYAEKRQPERVIYFMAPTTTQFEIRLNWEVKETWDISTAKIGEKPVELLKNKPKTKTNEKRDYREESNPRRSGGSSIRGMPF